MTGMDSLDCISVRFHFGGSFISSDGRMQYVGGCSGMSYIDVDKFSLPELKGHLADHVVTTNVMRMHWFRPGNGLMLLVDDRACQAMADHVTVDGIADVFVEDVSVLSNEAEDKADQWADDEAEHEKSRQSSEDKYTEGHFDGNCWEDVKGKAPAISDEEEGIDDTSDEDYNQPIEEDSSEEDEEVEEMRKFAKEVKKNIKAKKLGCPGSRLGDITPDTLFAEGCKLDDEAEIFMDSSDEYSYGENSDGESQRWKSLSNRYDSKAAVPIFTLGMAFRCSRQFKKALIKYGITTHRHILFPKDEKDKVRAVCSWPGCKWLIYG